MIKRTPYPSKSKQHRLNAGEDHGSTATTQNASAAIDKG